VLNSFNTKLRRVDVAEDTVRKSFYEDLEQKAELVFEVRPYSMEKEPPFLWEHLYGPAISLFDTERPGPTIRVYRIDHLQLVLQAPE
jgi:hypothetical protein